VPRTPPRWFRAAATCRSRWVSTPPVTTGSGAARGHVRPSVRAGEGGHGKPTVGQSRDGAWGNRLLLGHSRRSSCQVVTRPGDGSVQRQRFAPGLLRVSPGRVTAADPTSLVFWPPRRLAAGGTGDWRRPEPSRDRTLAGCAHPRPPPRTAAYGFQRPPHARLSGRAARPSTQRDPCGGPRYVTVAERPPAVTSTEAAPRCSRSAAAVGRHVQARLFSIRYQYRQASSAARVCDECRSMSGGAVPAPACRLAF
jgi:hypothetical protein